MSFDRSANAIFEKNWQNFFGRNHAVGGDTVIRCKRSTILLYDTEAFSLKRSEFIVVDIVKPSIHETV